MPAFPKIQIVMPPAEDWLGWRFRCAFDPADNSRSLIYDKDGMQSVVVGRLFLDESIAISLVQTPSPKKFDERVSAVQVVSQSTEVES